MRTLLTRIAAESDRAAGTTLVVGAGSGAELPLLRRLGSRRLILVEAHPRLAAELAARVLDKDREQVWAMAIAPEAADELPLQVLNNLRYSSLREPDRLFEHAPNLRSAPPILVKARSLAQAIAATVTDDEANNVLVLDAPGLSAALLAATDGRLLRRFPWLVIHASSIAERYQDEVSQQQIAEHLNTLGFETLEQDPDALYPEVITLYRRDTRRIAWLEHQAEVDRLKTELREARQAATAHEQRMQERLQGLQAEYDALRAQHDERAAQLEDEQQRLRRLQSDHDALQQEKTGLLADRNQQRRQLERLEAELGQQRVALEAVTTERDKLRARVTQIGSEGATLRERVQGLEREHDRQAAANAELEASANEQRLRADRLAAELDALGQERQGLRDRLERLEQVGHAAAKRQRELEDALEQRRQDATAMEQERDQQAQRATQLSEELDQLRREYAHLRRQTDAMEDSDDEAAKRGATELIASLDRAEQKLSMKQQRIDQLEYELTESNSRQRLLDEELVKAEAQLDLVKDLLLREQTL